MHPPLLPTINASFNASAGIFLIFGGIAIKNKKIQTHRKLMMGAFCCSALFLCTYLYYHSEFKRDFALPGQGCFEDNLFYCPGDPYTFGGIDCSFYHHGHTPCVKGGI